MLELNYRHPVLIFRSSCSITGQVFDVNDDVSIKGEHGKSYVCTIIGLFEDTSNEEPNRAEVCWYYEYSELPRKCKKSLKKEFIHERELFKAIAEEDDESYYPGVIEEIDAETIDSIIIVRTVNVKYKPPVNMDSNEYFVRYGFKKNGELCYLQNEDKKKTFSKESVTKQSLTKFEVKTKAQKEADKGIFQFENIWNFSTLQKSIYNKGTVKYQQKVVKKLLAQVDPQ